VHRSGDSSESLSAVFIKVFITIREVFAVILISLR
jgi:hypothetical protein